MATTIELTKAFERALGGPLRYRHKTAAGQKGLFDEPDSPGEHWVTINGPAALKGKTLKGLAKGKPGAELNRAIHKASKEHGFSKGDLHDAVQFVHEERARLHRDREHAKESARKLTGLTQQDVSRLSNAGFDYGSNPDKVAAKFPKAAEKLRHFDEFGQEVARQYPEAIGADPDDPHADFGQGLWRLLSEGKSEATKAHDPEVLEDAINLLHANRRYQPSKDLDAVPFSKRTFYSQALAIFAKRQLLRYDRGEYDESKHPRKSDGEFAPKGQGDSGAKQGHETSGKQPHSSGPMVSARREGKGKDAKIVMADGSAAPAHIKPSMIPPQWSDVSINTDPKADVMVRARDAKGRLKTVYSDSFTMKQAAKKFARVKAMLAEHDTIGHQIQADRQSDDPAKREAADCLWLIYERGVRPGSERDTKAKTKNYGATTLLAEHVQPQEDGSVKLEFRGKEGITNRHNITDPHLARMLVERKATAGERGGKLFDTSDTDLRKYMGTLGGGGFLVKDLRTALATKIAVHEIGNHADCCKNKKEYKAAVKRVAAAVSSVLNNRPAQAVSSYINPTVWSAWQCPDCATKYL